MAKRSIDIAAVLSGQVSKLDTTAPAFEEVKVDLIDPNEMNFFPVEDDLTDLAESIQLEGLLQPIVVTPTEDGRYRVIAGHRRRAAVLKLKEADPVSWQTVPCKIVHPESKALEELMLIQTNTEAREIGWSEKSTAATRVENILIQLKKENKIELPGKMRATVAKLIKTSESQIARAKYIKKHLTKEARAIHLNDNCAYRVAHLPEDWQRELVEHFKDNTWRIDSHEIKEFRERKQAGEEPFPPESEPTVMKCGVTPDVSSDAITSDVWYSDEPTESGYYWCVTGPLKQGGKLLYWDGQWQHPCAKVTMEVNVLCWMPCPSLPEEYTWNREGHDEETT